MRRRLFPNIDGEVVFFPSNWQIVSDILEMCWLAA
jgi:hypothetical protein